MCFRNESNKSLHFNCLFSLTCTFVLLNPSRNQFFVFYFTSFVIYALYLGEVDCVGLGTLYFIKKIFFPQQ